MEKKTKKRYEKPTLKGATAFEAAAALCCRSTVAICKKDIAQAGAKATRLIDAS